LRSRLAPGPLALLAACLLPVAGALAVSSSRTGALLLAAELLTFGALTRDVPASSRRLALGALAALSILASTWLYGGHSLDAAAGAALRVLAIVTPAALLTPAIGPSELGDHLAQRLHLPARAVVASVAALQRLDSLGRQWQQVQRARRARGYGMDGSPTRRLRALAAGTFALLVVSMRQTGQLSVAMDARGFANAADRTWAEGAPWRLGDSVVLAAASVLAVFPWFLR
jgi:energy-coupling factor transport system permease protein